MSTDLRGLYATDKAAFILTVADLRERRAKAATAAPLSRLGRVFPPADAEHIAAEANPEHALAAVRRWRGVVERHRLVSVATTLAHRNVSCLVDYAPYPCPDLTETADEALAYLGGPA